MTTLGLAYEPELLPSAEFMRREGVEVLEEWFRYAEEWAMLLRVYGHLDQDSDVLEVWCGAGRIAFPLRFSLLGTGTYNGFDHCAERIGFLRNTFQRAHPNFNFTLLDVANSYFNPTGRTDPAHMALPYLSSSFDVVVAASVFTHVDPADAGHYLKEMARVLRPGGRCLVSYFLLDNYRPARTRPLGFDRASFDFDHRRRVPEVDGGGDYAVVNPENTEEMVAYSLSLVDALAARVGLRREGDPLTGLWSGATKRPLSAQDVVVLVK